jgi:AspT/YidE/YbjL antiporter-like protein
MEWLHKALQAHPEIAFFVVLGLGYLFGKVSLGSFKLGAVTGTLLAGVLVGQSGIMLPNEVKQCFFLLFLFAIGFRTGPQFFRGLKSDGLQHAALAAIVATTGLIVAWIVAGVFNYDAGTAAGLVAGSLTESATIGTAMDSISRLPLPESERTALNNQIPVAFAVTYLVGVIGAAWVLSQLAPKLLRLNLADECRKLEEQMGAGLRECADRAAGVRIACLCHRVRVTVDRSHGRGFRILRWPHEYSSSVAAVAVSSRTQVFRSIFQANDTIAVSDRARRSLKCWRRPAVASWRSTIATCST